jgi:sugar fermentation stimulation protein A
MKFTTPLIPGQLVKRYKRFLADVTLANGETVTATCPNTGSMMGLTTPGSRVWLSESNSPTRKYRHTWEMIEADLGAGPSLVGINTGHPNKLVAEAIAAGLLPDCAGYPVLRREVKYGVASRIDILLECPTRGLAYVEVKNVHMMRNAGLAEFPDSVTERGVKHLGELAAMVKEGHRAVMVFLVQRGDAQRLSLARDVDRAYGEAFDRAVAAGVEAVALACRVSPDEIAVERAIPIV